MIDTFLKRGLSIGAVALMLGMILGTVSTLLGGGIASTSLFAWLWALIQATGVDVAFMVSGLLLFSRSLSVRGRWGYGVLTLLYSIPAFMTVNVTSYQELFSTSLPATMAKLGIDMSFFTTSRSVVVIATALLLPIIERSAQQHLFSEAAPELVQITPVPVVSQVITPVPAPLQIDKPGSENYQVSHRIEELDKPHENPMVELEKVITPDDKVIAQVENPYQAIENRMAEVEKDYQLENPPVEPIHTPYDKVDEKQATNDNRGDEKVITGDDNENATDKLVRGHLENGLSVGDIVRITGLSQATIYRIKKRIS